MGQPPLGLPLGGPGVAEIDVNEVHFPRREIVRQQRRVAHHEEHVFQFQRRGPLHGHHQGVGHLLDGDKQNVWVLSGGLGGEAPLAAAQLYPQFSRLGHQRLPPAPPQGEAVLHLAGGAFFHPRNEIFLFPHPHGILPPE